MNGVQFVVILKNEFGINVGAATASQWKAKKQLTPTILRNALYKFESQKLNGAVTPIVEFHELNFEHGQNVDTLAKRIDDKSVVKELQESQGIYAFFETQGRLVYIGKTEKNNLLAEMAQRYKGKEVPFRILKNRKPQWVDARIQDVAQYFSAYRVHPNLIANVEALLTRIVTNNAHNVQVARFTAFASSLRG